MRIYNVCGIIVIELTKKIQISAHRTWSTSESKEFTIFIYKIHDNENRAASYPELSLGDRKVFLFITPVFEVNLTIGLMPSRENAEKLLKAA